MVKMKGVKTVAGAKATAKKLLQNSAMLSAKTLKALQDAQDEFLENEAADNSDEKRRQNDGVRLQYTWLANCQKRSVGPSGRLRRSGGCPKWIWSTLPSRRRAVCSEAAGTAWVFDVTPCFGIPISSSLYLSVDALMAAN